MSISIAQVSACLYSVGYFVCTVKQFLFKKITTNNNTTVVSHGGDTITINVYGAQGQNEEVLANIVMRKIEELQRRKERKEF